MVIDARIVTDYIAGADLNQYRNCWIYNCFGKSSLFEMPDPKNKIWVSRLYDKIVNQIEHFIPRNGAIVKQLFPQFDRLAAEYTILLIVGLPDPYDAMVLEHDGKAYMIFDLIQFKEAALSKNYSCHRVLTHELIHICLMEDYPVPYDMPYVDKLSYTAFNEGFAHALTYPEDISCFVFDEFLCDKFEAAKRVLLAAMIEKDKDKQAVYLRNADTGDYWDKFAAMAGKLYLLKHIDKLKNIYREGWHNFTEKILTE